MEVSNEQKGILYIVGTPIGNLEDITFRAIRILKEVDIIAAEDTRHTAKLLKHFAIATPQISYHEHNRQLRQNKLLQRLIHGENIALVTDAGMPGISDPGYELILACIETQIRVVPIPGVTACITALVASGLKNDQFVFEGFLPTKLQERQTRLERISSESRTVIFYESPHRLKQTLLDLTTVLGEERRVTLGRELTKLHEEFWRGSLGKAYEHYQHQSKIKGEFTLVVAGADKHEMVTLSPSQLKAELKALLNQGLTRSQASRQLAQLSHLSRREIYQLTLEIDDDPAESFAP